jgi:phage-related minor tail protein
MSKTLRIAIVTVAVLAAGSSAVMAQNSVRTMDNDWRNVEQSGPSASTRAARAERAAQIRHQQDLQVLPWSGFDRDGSSPRVDIQ